MHWPFALRRVVGHSMMPTLKPGMLLVVRRGADIRLGDVVVARSGGKEVVKRVLDLRAREVYLVGDNKSTAHDLGWLKKSEIIGRAYALARLS